MKLAGNLLTKLCHQSKNGPPFYCLIMKRNWEVGSILEFTGQVLNSALDGVNPPLSRRTSSVVRQLPSGVATEVNSIELHPGRKRRIHLLSDKNYKDQYLQAALKGMISGKHLWAQIW